MHGRQRGGSESPDQPSYLDSYLASLRLLRSSRRPALSGGTCQFHDKTGPFVLSFIAKISSVSPNNGTGNIQAESCHIRPRLESLEQPFRMRDTRSGVLYTDDRLVSFTHYSDLQ